VEENRVVGCVSCLDSVPRGWERKRGAGELND